MADINKEASWVTARLMEVSNATQDGTNILITNANLNNFVPANVVRTSAQTLTDAEKTQARTNIGAASNSDVQTAISAVETELDDKVDKPENAEEGNVAIFGNNGNIEDSGTSLADIYDAAMISKTASGRVIKIYDGADGVSLKSAILHINPRKNSVNEFVPWKSGIFNVRKQVLLYGDDMIDQFRRYNANVLETAPGYEIIGVPASGAETDYWNAGGYDGIQYENEPYTFVWTMAKSSGTSGVVCFRTLNTANTGYNFANLETPVTQKRVVFNLRDINGLNYVGHTSRGSVPTLVYPYESYIVEGSISSVDEIPEYVGERILRQYPTDVYAGEFDLVTGILSVCPVIESYNGETLTGSWTSTLDEYVPGTTPTTGAFVIDLDGEKTTYQIDPVILHTLKGYNRIWADFRCTVYSNELEIEYYADPSLALAEATTAIKESIAPVEDSYTASRAYAVGNLVYVGDVLYRVTAAISSGNTISPNVNAVETTISTEIQSLR